MEYPKYKYFYRKYKCPIGRVYVNITSKFEYIPEKDKYRLTEQLCDREINPVKCSHCPYRRKSFISDLPLVELSPNDSAFLPQEHLTD